MTERPQPWLLKHLGVLAPGASPALREDYARRAGIAAATAKQPGSPTLNRPSPRNPTGLTPNSTPCGSAR
jgi:hypothetical protein